MATATDTIYVEILAKTQNASAGIASFIKQVAGAYISYRAFKELLVSSIKEGLEAERAFIKLGSALRASGQNTEVYTKQLQGLARGLSMTTTFAEEERMEAMHSLTQIGRVSSEGMKQIIPVVQDLAAGLGMDLNSAALLVGKAIEGNVGALSRYGIKIKETSDPAERFSEIIKALTERFGGMSQAMADAASGGLLQIRNEFNELKEAVGTRLLQAFSGTISRLSSFMKSSAIMNMDISEIGRKEEADAYIKVLNKEWNKMFDDISKFKNQGGIAAALYVGGGAYQKQLKYLNEIATSIKNIREASTKLNEIKAPLLLSGVSGDAVDKIKKVAEYAEVSSYWYESGGEYIQNQNKALAAQILEWEAIGRGIDNDITALAIYQGKITSEPPPAPGWSGYRGWENAAMSAAREAAAQKEAAAIKKLKEQYKDLFTQIADAAVVIGTLLAEGNTEEAFKQALKMAATLITQNAIAAAAAAGAQMNWPLMFFWLGVAGVGIGMSIAGGMGGNTNTNSSAPDLPHMARGGIVSRPTLALIGENGPEAVIPLGRRGGGGNTIIVQGSIWAAKDLARELAAIQGSW